MSKIEDVHVVGKLSVHPWSHSASLVQPKLLRTLPILSKFTFPFISFVQTVQSRWWVVIWKALVALYRLGILPRPNIDSLPIDSTKSTPLESGMSSQSRPKFQFFNKMNRISTTTITAITIFNIVNKNVKIDESFTKIITARPPSGRPRYNTLFFKAAASLIIVTCKISKSDHFNAVCSRQLARCISNSSKQCSGRARATLFDDQPHWC